MNRRSVRSALRSATLISLVAALVGTTSCSDPAGPTRPPPDASGPGFPVRLLPTVSSAATRTLLDDALQDLSPWWLLDDRARLLPAADHPDVQLIEGGVRLARAGQALVRFQDRPAQEGGTFSARLSADGAVHPPEGNSLLAVLELRDDVAADGESTPRVARWLQRCMGDSARPPTARWITANDRAGQASLSATFPARSKPGRLALVLVASRDGATLGRVSLATRPQVIRNRDAQFYERGEHQALAEPTVSPIQLGVDRRDAVLVGPAQSYELRATIPPGARGVWLGVGPLPGSTLGTSSYWTLEASIDGGPMATLGSGEISVSTEIPVLLTFEDQRLEWPAGWSAGGQLVARLSVKGNAELAFGQPLVHGPSAPGRKNLLLISIDTVRADHLGWHGYERPTTPALDAFVSGGTVFLNASSTAPFTLPSHASMLTGLLPARHGAVNGGTDALDPTAVAYLPVLLAAAGWHTAAFTGGGMMSSQYGFAPGFDRFRAVDPIGMALLEGPLLPVMPAYTDELKARTQQLQIEALPEQLAQFGDEPWFVFLHTFAAHNYTTPLSDLAAIQPVPHSGWGQRHAEVDAYLKSWHKAGVIPDRVERLRDLYDASLHYLDRRLGAFLDDLRQRGLLDNTIVVLVSDHGEEFNEHGGLLHGRTLFEELLHVPLVFRGPGIPAGRRIGESVSLTDLLPTLLELLEVETTHDGLSLDLDGRSLTPLLGARRSSPDQGPQMVAHVATSRASGMSYRSGRYKLVRMRRVLPDGDTTLSWALYDLAQDPTESTDISARRPDLLHRLRDAMENLESRLAQNGAHTSQAQIDPALAAQLQALGYADFLPADQR